MDSNGRSPALGAGEVPDVVAGLAEAPEDEPFELEVELGGIPDDARVG
jgi:hypothetical protein